MFYSIYINATTITVICVKQMLYSCTLQSIDLLEKKHI